MAKDVLDLLQRERVELDDLRLRPEGGRHDAASLILAVDLHHDPCLVHPVLASPVCLAQKMRSAPEKDLDGAGTRHHLLFVRNLDEESRHDLNLLSARAGGPARIVAPPTAVPGHRSAASADASGAAEGPVDDAGSGRVAGEHRS